MFWKLSANVATIGLSGLVEECLDGTRMTRVGGFGGKDTGMIRPGFQIRPLSETTDRADDKKRRADDKKRRVYDTRKRKISPIWNKNALWNMHFKGFLCKFKQKNLKITQFWIKNLLGLKMTP